MSVKVKCAMDQYIDGLSSIGLTDRILKNPSIWEPMFIKQDSQLSPGTIFLQCKCACKLSIKLALFSRFYENFLRHFVR